MKKTVAYIHGQGGSAEEAMHYAPLFPDCEVVGLNYAAQTPWEARSEFPELFADIAEKTGRQVTLVANSIGAFFAMQALEDFPLERAFFISPVTDMEKLIGNMMAWANVTEEELQARGVIETSFGQTLSWAYLCDVRSHPVCWNVPTYILYGGRDTLTSLETVTDFARKTGAALTVMADGEHWFHTPEQMAFLDKWIRENR